MSIVLDHHVIWLQISVNDSLIMQIFEREYKLRRVEPEIKPANLATTKIDYISFDQ